MVDFLFVYYVAAWDCDDDCISMCTVFVCLIKYYSRTCLGRPLVWAATRLGRPQSLARIVSNNKVPGVSDHLLNATSDRIIWSNQR